MGKDSKISVPVAMAVGLGAIIGAGIFVLSGTAIALAGSDAIIAFILVGIVALLVAVELGELGSIMPKVKGASYSYIYNAFGSELGFISGILLYFSYATSISAIALGFGSYAASLLGLNVVEFSRYFSIAIIGVLSVVNLIGIKKATKVDSYLVAIKITILLLFIAFAIITVFLLGKGLYGKMNLIAPIGGFEGIFAASVAIFFAYSGFQAISTFTSRIKGGARGAAKAIMYSVIISIVIYVLVAIALLIMMPSKNYTINADPLSFALKAVNAPLSLLVVVDIGALIATASATLAMILSSSRILYQISSDRLLPAVLRKYNSKTDVAINGVILSAVIGVAMLFSGNIFIIAAISNFGLLFSYLLSSFAVIHFRRIKQRASFKVPFYPYLPLFTIFGIMLLLIGMPKESLVIGVMIILSLIIVYYFLREAKRKKVVKIRLFR
jgi:APA family basic amino acid/polyamine antiporter